MKLLRVAPFVPLALACREEPPTAAGERVDLRTEVVEQVCRGTLDHLDGEIARIEAELGLAPSSTKVELHIVSDEQIGEHCEPYRHLCVVQPPRRIYMTAGVYDEIIVRELVRDRVSRGPAGGTKPLLFEGLAAALSRPRCEPAQSWEPPIATKLLAAQTNSQLGSAGRYLGGELTRWLLDTRGPAELLALMAEVRRDDEPVDVRVAYTERFASSIDVDLYTHWQPIDEAIEPARAGCVSPEAPLDELGLTMNFEAELDCDSPRVRNDFGEPGRVFVEWNLKAEGHGGLYSFLGSLPEDVELTIEPCACELTHWTEPVLFDPVSELELDTGRLLDPGVYRIRASGPIGASVKFQIVTPCDYAAQNCPAGQQCLPSGDCVDEVPEPAQHQQPCTPPIENDDLWPCAVGLTCVGPFTEENAGVCLPYCGHASVDMSCPGELSCEFDQICTDSCDPLAQDCAEGWGCQAERETGDGGCVPVGDLGLLEPCSVLNLGCGPGLTCVDQATIPECTSDAWINFSGCCTPYCDPQAAESGCPPELPNCEAVEDEVIGVCRP